MVVTILFSVCFPLFLVFFSFLLFSLSYCFVFPLSLCYRIYFLSFYFTPFITFLLLLIFSRLPLVICLFVLVPSFLSPLLFCNSFLCFDLISTVLSLLLSHHRKVPRQRWSWAERSPACSRTSPSDRSCWKVKLRRSSRRRWSFRDITWPLLSAKPPPWRRRKLTHTATNR